MRVGALAVNFQEVFVHSVENCEAEVANKQRLKSPNGLSPIMPPMIAGVVLDQEVALTYVPWSALACVCFCLPYAVCSRR